MTKNDTTKVCENATCKQIARHDVRLADGTISALCRNHANWAVDHGATFEDDRNGSGIERSAQTEHFYS